MKPINEVNIHTWKLDVDDDHIPEKAIAQANWNQNDEMAEDYVKNRPFYSETVKHPEAVFLEEMIINTSPCTISEYAAPFVVGDSYKVTWDGTVYECVAYQCDGSIAIGNSSIIGSSGSDSIDVDFFVGITSSGMLIFHNSSQSTHTISISNGGNEEIIIHTIDKKYLPKLIGASGEGENSEIFNSVINNASGNCSHADGYETKAIGKYSHAEGFVATASGDCSHAEGDHTTASSAGSHAEGDSTTASSISSHAEGHATEASGKYSHAEGNNATASSIGSHAEGYETKASNDYSHAEGYSATASGDCSHAEGHGTTAIATGSHAEGHGTTARGFYSHTEGDSTTASGTDSHAEGFVATASGVFSHAEGDHTTANGDCQHAQGRYNIVDSDNTYAHIVGNGTSEYALSNAHTLDWSGNAWFAGTVEGIALILKSSTTDSTKRFKITVDDSGVISATEVTMES